MYVRSMGKVMLSAIEIPEEGVAGENIEAAGRPKEQLLNHQAIVRAKTARGELCGLALVVLRLNDEEELQVPCTGMKGRPR